MHRAYSVLTLKAVDEEKRQIIGIATTPTPDRVGDIVEPKGAEFQLPIPLLWQHDSRQPIGHVTEAKVTDAGIEVVATLVKIDEPGPLRDRLDTAWQSIKSGLVRGFSIGFKELEYARLGESWSYRYLKWLWLELSAVTIPANGDCSITAIKSADDAQRRAASGRNPLPVVRLKSAGPPGTQPPGVPGSRTKAASSGLFHARKEPEMNIAEQLAAFDTRRKSAIDQMEDIMTKAADEGRTLDEHETEQYDGFQADVKSIDGHLARLKAHEAILVAKATPVPADAGTDPSKTDPARNPFISVKSNLPPGIRFTRFALSMAHARGNVMLAYEIAKDRFADTPEVATCLKAAISMGGTKDFTLYTKAAVTAVTGTDTAVVQYSDLENEFIDLLRPKMVIGRMEQLNRVPFLSRVGRQLTGVTGSFVGEGAPKPVQKQTYDNVTLSYAKVAVIVVLTDEAVRFSTIQAQMRARDDMVKGIATYLDKRFMDPAYSGVANVSPASITNGARRVQSSGSTLAAIDADVRNAMAEFSASDVDPTTAVWVMNGATALKLATKRNSYDELAFPGMENAIATGRGTWYGLPVLVSNAMVASGSPAENQIALVTQEEVFMAEDTGISIDMSQEASVQMNDAPSAGAQSLVSLWQNNLVGIRAEQFINWAPRRTSNLGIVLIENTNY